MLNVTTDSPSAISLARRNALWQSEPFVPAQTTPLAPGKSIDLGQTYLTGSPPPHIAKAAADALARGETHYVDRVGIKPLREAIAATYARDGYAGITPDELLVTSGAQEALFVLLRSLMQPGDEIVVPDPGYPLLNPIAQLAGGVVIPVSSVADNFQFKAEHYVAALTGRTRFLFLLSPNPATGLVIPPQEFEQILKVAAQHDLVVILDEALKQGIYDGVTRLSFPDGLPENLFVIGSVSKLYRMSGWRIGWLAGNSAQLAPLRDLKQALSICSAAVSQWAAVAALTGPQAWLAEQMVEFGVKRDLVLHALPGLGLSPLTPEAAFYVWVKIARTGYSAQEFADLFLQHERVRVTPGTHLGAAGENHIRISLSPPRARLLHALEHLEKFQSPRRT